MSREGSSSFQFACEFRHETDNAILVYDYQSNDELWLPLSAVLEIHGNKVRGSEIEVVIEEWLARKRGLL